MTNIKTVQLDTPIQRGEQIIDTVQIRQPKSGEMRNLSMVDLGQLKVDALIKILPRITIPNLSEVEVANMPPRRSGGLRRRGRQFFASEVEACGCPRSIDDAMADVAVVFHWPPQAMDDMSISELMGWREKAAKRSQPPKKSEK